MTNQTLKMLHMQTASCEAHYKVHITGEGWLPRSPGQSHHLNERACISRLIYLTEWSQSTGECVSKKISSWIPSPAPSPSVHSYPSLANVEQESDSSGTLREVSGCTSARVGGTSSGSVSTPLVIIWGFWRMYCDWWSLMLAYIYRHRENHVWFKVHVPASMSWHAVTRLSSSLYDFYGLMF